MTHPPLTRAELDRLEELQTKFLAQPWYERPADMEDEYIDAVLNALPQLLALARQALEQQERDIDDKFRAQTEDY